MMRQTLNLTASALALALTFASRPAALTDEPTRALLGKIDIAFPVVSGPRRPVDAEQALLGRWIREDNGRTASAGGDQVVAIGPERALLGQF